MSAATNTVELDNWRELVLFIEGLGSSYQGTLGTVTITNLLEEGKGVIVQWEEAHHFRRARFHIDGWAESVKGYTEGKYWNGWAMPCFTFEQATKIVEMASNADNPARYLPQTDTFEFVMDGGGEASFDNPLVDDYREGVDAFKGEDIVIDGQSVHVYPIGAGSWTWDEVKESASPTEYQEKNPENPSE